MGSVNQLWCVWVYFFFFLIIIISTWITHKKKKSMFLKIFRRGARDFKTPPLSPGAFAAQKLQFPLSFARPSPQSCQSTASWELESPRRISHFSPSHGFRKNYLGWLVCDNGSVPGELNSTDMNSS